MKTKELRELTVEELNKKVKELSEELFKNPMTKTEGEQFYFTKDSKNIIEKH